MQKTINPKFEEQLNNRLKTLFTNDKEIVENLKVCDRNNEIFVNRCNMLFSLIRGIGKKLDVKFEEQRKERNELVGEIKSFMKVYNQSSDNINKNFSKLEKKK